MNGKTMKPSKIKALAKKIGVSIIGLALVGATVASLISYHNTNKANHELLNSLAKVNAENKALMNKLSSSQTSITELKEQLNSYNISVEEFKKETLKKDAVISDYKKLVEELNSSVSSLQDTVATAEEVFKGYESDDMMLNASLSLSLDKHDLDSLKTIKYEFDDETIKDEKSLLINGTFDSNSKDFDGTTMLKFEAGDIKYVEKFDTDMTSLNFSSEDLKINFLGKDLTITAWTNNSITLDTSKESKVLEGDVVDNVSIVRIGKDSVLISYNDELKIIDENSNHDFGDLVVSVESVFYSDEPSERLAVIKIGEDLSKTIVDGDEYNNEYDWVVTKDSLGLVLSEDFDQYDSALLSTESLNIFDKFNLFFESNKPELSTLSIDYRSDDDIRFKGNFEDGSKIVFNGTEFVDSEDESLGTKVFFEDSDYFVEYNGSSFLVGDVEINKNITKVLMDGIDFSSKDCLVKSNEGFLINDPEDSLEDQELTIKVPVEAETLVVKVE